MATSSADHGPVGGGGKGDGGGGEGEGGGGEGGGGEGDGGGGEGDGDWRTPGGVEGGEETIL